MSLNKEKQSAEDQYLDLIIKLAFERKAELEIEQLLNEPDPELTEEEKAAADIVFQAVLAEEDEQRRKEKRTQSILFFRNALLNVCKVAACLIIVAGIAVPIAVATSSQFRSKVMQLLMDIDTVNNEAHFSFVENEDAAFYVPEGWEGEWYPTYIPNGMVLTGMEQLINRAEYRNEKDGIFWFYEFDYEINSMIGIEDATIDNLDINGFPAWLLSDGSDKQRISVIWSTDDKWFQIDSSLLSEQTVLDIAYSVKKIVK